MQRIETNRVYNENCIETMRRMPGNYVDLVVTSPPYDGLRKYNGFCLDFQLICVELTRTLKEGGVIVWITGDATVDGSETCTSFKNAMLFMSLGLKLWDTMIWEKTGRLPTQNRYYNCFDYMFVLSKGKPKSMNFICDNKNTDKPRARIRYSKCSKEGGVRTEKRFMTQEFSRRSNVWKIPNNINKTEHPAVFPEKLANDHIITWSNPGDIVYDPFAGSGTTAKMSILNGRQWIASEISPEYCEIIKERLSGLHD